MKVIGIRRFDYTSKYTGTTRAAVNLYVVEKSNRVEGLSADKIFCYAESLPDGLKLQDDINVLYDKYGHVQSITVVS